jgi:hypothetical protein
MSDAMQFDDKVILLDRLLERVNFTLVRDFNYGGFDGRVTDLDEIEATGVVAIELMREAERWRVLNQRRLIALESVEWIMVDGRVQCPSCLKSREEGHGVLCLLDESLRPTAEKLKLREEQEALYTACRTTSPEEQAK